jgi:hypothetical protein
MAEKKHLECFVLRYVADAIKEIAIPIGIVMHEPGVEGGYADSRFTRDWRVVQCVDPEADIEMLVALGREIKAQLSVLKNPGILTQFLQDSSNLVRVSQTKGCFTQNPEMEIERVARMYLDPRKVLRRESLPKGGSRQVIVNKMRDAWELAGLAGLIRQQLEVAQYTRPGDPFKIDFGYNVGKEIKLFHAVSLKKSVDAAERLAYRYPQIAKGMERQGWNSKLTSVVDDGLDASKSDVRFALDTLEESRIFVTAIAEMPKIARQAKRDLLA